MELQDELPALWDKCGAVFFLLWFVPFSVPSLYVNVRLCVCVCSRVGIYVTTFQALAGHQEKFHKEMSKVS